VALDPRNPRARGQWAPPGPIPPHVRSFGFFPNTAAWKPGDILLFSAVKSNPLSRAIVHAQLDFGSEHARWHHAAAFVGDDSICEATIYGVRIALLYEYIGSHVIRLLRDPKLLPEDGYKIAIQMAARLGTPYSFAKILQSKIHSRLGYWRPWPYGTLVSRACICSELYVQAHSRVTNRVLVQMRTGTIPPPAALSQSDKLVEVETEWLQIS
jgi:hypothetical protein